MQTTTAYEIAVQAGDGRRFLIAYSQRRTVQCLMSNINGCRKRLVPLIDDSDYCRDGLRIVGAGGWWIDYSGRTEFVARQDGELPRIAWEGSSMALDMNDAAGRVARVFERLESAGAEPTEPTTTKLADLGSEPYREAEQIPSAMLSAWRDPAAPNTY